MRYYITKTNLDVFDTSRAWGLAFLLHVITEDDVLIKNDDVFFIIETQSQLPENINLKDNDLYNTIFAYKNEVYERIWKNVFRTSKKQWEYKRKRVKEILIKDINLLLDRKQNPDFDFDFIFNSKSCENLPGSLDPAAFRGSRSESSKRFIERQLKIQRTEWALSALGMVIAGYYLFAKKGNNVDVFIFLPVPTEVYLSSHLAIKEKFDIRQSPSLGVTHAAAMFSIELAERVRSLKAQKTMYKEKYEEFICFELFGAGQQVKPKATLKVNIANLMEAIEKDADNTEISFKFLKNCLFSHKQNPQLASAAADLIMNLNIEKYSRFIDFFGVHSLRERKDVRPTLETLQKIVSMLNVDYSELITNNHLIKFSERLRLALMKYGDYDSYIGIKNSKSKEKLLEEMRKFTERYIRLAIVHKLKHLDYEAIEQIMNLVDKYGVKAVVAMIISVCNTKAQKDEDKKGEKKEEKKKEKTKEPAADFSVES